MKANIFILALTAVVAPIYSQPAPCTQTTGTNCNACQAPGLLLTGTTCGFCPNMGWKAADVGTTAGTCTATPMVPTGCITGGSATSCSACAAGYAWQTNSTCMMCGAGTGKAADTTVQSGTAGTCTANGGGSALTGCSVYGASGVCVMCANGYYMASGATTCTACMAGCAACTTGTACSYCAANYVWTATGVCTMCPNNGTAPAQTMAPTALQTTAANCTAATTSSTSKASFIVSAVSVFAAFYALF